MEKITPHRYLVAVPRVIIRLIVVRAIPFTVMAYIDNEALKTHFFLGGQGRYESADDY